MNRARRPRRRSRAGRRILVLVVILIVLAGLAVAADRIARGYVENRVAAQIQRQGFPSKPDVTIEGFPFLTQLIARDFPDVRVAARDVTERQIRFKTITATLNGVHVNAAYHGGTVDRLTGHALVAFPALAGALASAVGRVGSLGVGRSLASAISLSAAGPHEVRAAVDLLVTGSVTWRVSVAGHHELVAELVASHGLPSVVADAVRTVTVPLPALPFGLRIRSVRVTRQGVVGEFAGRDLAFGS